MPRRNAVTSEGVADRARSGVRKDDSVVSDNPDISIVVPAHNEEGNVDLLHRRISAVLENSPYTFELIFVDDGSSDGTWNRIKALYDVDDRVKVISLSRRFGHQNALTAGLDNARGRAIISMDADLQHPPELIPELLRLWEKGNQVVYTIRTSGDDISFFKKISANAFYKLINIFSTVRVDPNSSDFRLIDRRVCDVLTDHRDRERFYRGLVKWVGFRQTSIEFKAGNRHAGQTSYRLGSMLNFALIGILLYSHIPIFLVIVMSIFLTLTALGYSLYVLYQKLILGIALPGHTSILMVILIMGSMQLLTTAMCTVYVYKNYQEAKLRPLYIVNEAMGFHP